MAGVSPPSTGRPALADTMTISELSKILQCPECGGSLDFESVPQAESEVGGCGLLRCSCFVYPVLDGVPILTQKRLLHRSIADDRAIAGGPFPNDLAKRIGEGRAIDGLVDLLAFPVCPWPLNRIGALRRLSLGGLHHRLGLGYRRRRVRRMLQHRDQLTAEDWLAAFYWHAPAPFDPFNYFFFRFGQPRHLATLALLAVLPQSEAPLLDLACGYGHFLHTVTANGQAAVGLDQNFHQMWVARHYVAPQGAFVCADAASTLPFQDNVFSAALCADAFQYFKNKQAVLGNLDRCVVDGPFLIACAGNRLVGSPDSEELTPKEYTDLLNIWKWRALSEEDMLSRYFDHLGPDLRTSSATEDLDASRWLYFLAAKDDTLFRDHDAFDAWPHAAGLLDVNPIYEVGGDGIRFQFPSPWYKAENQAMRNYMPALASLQNDRDVLLAQCVLVGLPERYSRTNGRPWPVQANRRLQNCIRYLKPS